MTRRDGGSSHRGTIEWLVQRLTSVYIGAFALFVAARIAFMPGIDYAGWAALWNGGMRFGLALFFGATLVHAWIGMRSVYLDYVKPWPLRLAVAALTAVWLFAVALYAVRIVWN